MSNLVELSPPESYCCPATEECVTGQLVDLNAVLSLAKEIAQAVKHPKTDMDFRCFLILKTKNIYVCADSISTTPDTTH